MNGFESVAPNENHAETSHSPTESRSNGPTHSGITLVLPSLKAIKAAKSGKKGKGKNLAFAEDAGVKKIPRPPKLKPLKEVLTKLIYQIKKKDDYAFFISPVDPAQVPGYSDSIKRPMDFGTMSAKVAKAKYRSLEEFATDFRLVTSNAKTFNLPGTIYHTEADRIEAFGLEHISKAAATVIEYETDWNIEIEQDDEGALKVDDDEENPNASTPRDAESSQMAASPAPSSIQVQPTKRGPRGSYKKGVTISESIDAEGRLPGSKDGLNAFRPGSDWAALMLTLKIRGKRYRTKRERLRIEKEGPPYCPDGSLDYFEMEDPFSVLNVFGPDPMSKPQLLPLYPPLPSEDISPIPFPVPVNIPPDRPVPELATVDSSSTAKPSKKRRHWTIVKNAPSRAKAKEKEDEDTTPAWKVPRDPLLFDYGSFADLPSVIAEDINTQDISGALGSEEKLFGAIRSTVEHRLLKRKLPESENDYWTDQKAVEAEEYIRDVVYGGVDGLAYIRSLAEFLRPPDGCKDVGQNTLGMPLTKFIEETILDPVTQGRHRILREAAAHLYNHRRSVSPSVSSRLSAAISTHPTCSQHLKTLQELREEQLDMAALILAPEELFASENEWAGATHKAEMRRKSEEAREKALAETLNKNAVEYLALAIQSHKESEGGKVDSAILDEGPEVYDAALAYSVEALEELQKRLTGPCPKVKVEPNDGEEPQQDGGAMEVDSANGDIKKEKAAEDPLVRKLRLNLLALAKRAPLDKIARLPADMVPEHIRNFVPTV
ncbi:hypothetical protein BJ138DRAFT_1070003 [Hygrophoropsis aurantiaca]|uniref:Uncharacterized protein n=1 Tax=Hygrophoropsis aurantiaca TaxID=72124 RepID=A0ACB8A3J2_9AGAM|nr:hypothetical protein BJ138DRAFT_1070003 [Hygrophoropsis aurantiaca]